MAGRLYFVRLCPRPKVRASGSPMKIRVFSLAAKVNVDKPLYTLPRRDAPVGFFETEIGELLPCKRFLKISRGSVQLQQRHESEPEPMILTDGPFGIGNMFPFTRIPDPLRKPPSINYPIPAVGARTRAMNVYLINAVPVAASLALGAIQAFEPLIG